MHSDAPAAENYGLGRAHSLDRLTIPRRGEAGDGAQFGLLGHAVPTDELSALRADDSVDRLPKVETANQTLEGEFAAHDERVERFLRFGPELLEFLLMCLGAGCAGVLELLIDGLLLRLPHRLTHVVGLDLHFVADAELPLVLLLRGEGVVVSGGLALSRLGDAPKPATRWLRLPGRQVDVDVCRDGKRRRSEHRARAHLQRRLHEIANGLSGAGKIRTQRVERKGLGRWKRPHQRLRRCTLVAGIFGGGSDQARKLFRAAASGVPVNDVALLRQIG